MYGAHMAYCDVQFFRFMYVHWCTARRHQVNAIKSEYFVLNNVKCRAFTAASSTTHVRQG